MKTQYIVVVAIVVAAGIIAAVVGRQSSGSPLDSGLKQSADRLAAHLHEPDKPYVGQPFLNDFNLYQHTQQTTLQGPGRSDLKSGQFAQIVVYETSTMPPVYRGLKIPGKPAITIQGNLLSKVAGGSSTFTTVQQGNVQFRGYLTKLTVPPTLRQGKTYEVLEVFQAQPT